MYLEPNIFGIVRLKRFFKKSHHIVLEGNISSENKAYFRLWWEVAVHVSVSVLYSSNGNVFRESGSRNALFRCLDPLTSKTSKHPLRVCYALHRNKPDKLASSTWFSVLFKALCWKGSTRDIIYTSTTESNFESYVLKCRWGLFVIWRE